MQPLDVATPTQSGDLFFGLFRKRSNARVAAVRQLMQGALVQQFDARSAAPAPQLSSRLPVDVADNQVGARRFEWSRIRITVGGQLHVVTRE